MEPNEEDDNEYVKFIFDSNRRGMRHIAFKIFSYLDFRSFIRFKQTCSTVYSFISSSNIEEDKLNAKLYRDWKHGWVEEDVFSVLSVDAITHLLIINQGKHILASEGKSIVLYDAKTKDSIRKFTNKQENQEKNLVTRFDIACDKYLVGGSNNGVLSLWDLHTGVLRSSKQLFGIISGVKCKDDIIVTSHFGKGCDKGCVSVRKMKTPEDLEVVWCSYQDIVSIFCFDFNREFICTIEWLGTFDNTHVGSVSVYKRSDTLYRRMDLGEHRAVDSRRSAHGLLNNLMEGNRRYTCLRLVGDHDLALGSDDGPQKFRLVIWNLDTFTCIHAFGGHSQMIVEIEVAGQRIVSRDKNGKMLIWDCKVATDPKYNEDENGDVLMRELNFLNEKNISCISMDLTSLSIARTFPGAGSISTIDFWNASRLPVAECIGISSSVLVT